MKLEGNGALVTFEAPETLIAGALHELIVEVEPSDAATRVEAVFRRNGGEAKRAEGRPLERSEGEAKRLALELPAFASGDHITITVRAAPEGRRPRKDEDEATFEVDVREETAAVEDSGRPVEERLTDLLPEPDAAGARRAAAKLEKLGITTPADLLASGEEALANLPSRDRRVVRKLAGHAALALTVADARQRSALLEAGFDSPVAIASVPALDVQNAVGNAIPAERVEELHIAASAQTAFLSGLSATSYTATAAPLTAAPARQRCGCDDCEAATSPLAYLTDLIAYVHSSVQLREYGGGSSALAVDTLTELLRQPLKDLIASCGTVTEPVRQVRLLIETLRQHLNATAPVDADVICSPFPLPLEQVVAADVDGDRRDELVVVFRGSASSWLTLPENVHAGCFVMDFDPVAKEWKHLQPMSDAVGADFLLGEGLVPIKAVAADVDGDGRDELVIAVRRQDGSAHPSNGRTWFWVMDYDPAQRQWSHLNPQTFAQTDADLWLGDQTMTFVDLLAGDIDGDDEDEVIVSVTSTAQPNAFWVWDYFETLSGQRWWMALSPNIDSSLPAFEFEQPTATYASYKPRLAFTWDADNNGRDEIVGFPDAPGGLGGNAWVMAYDPPQGGPSSGQVGTWRHLNGNPGVNTTDLPAPWGWPARAAHAFGGSTRGLNSSALLSAPEAVGTGTNASDPNMFFEVQYDSTGTPDPWTAPESIDSATIPRRVSAAFMADVDGDLTDELVAVIESAGRRAAWVMDRGQNGQWQHISPITGHTLQGDLEWTSRDYVFRGALAADIDRTTLGTLHQELVFYGTNVNSIWVVRFDETTRTWKHVSPAVATDVEAPYLREAYERLLAQLGTSLEELRAIRGADQDAREALAQRLGVIPQPDPAKPDTLERLLIAPSDLTEARLEELFGLVDTTRDPLSDGPIRSDGRRQVVRFELEEVAWSRNPWVANVGKEGDLRLALAKESNGKIRVDLFRPDGVPVASGVGDPTSRIGLSSGLGPGLLGSVQIAYSQDTTSIELGALPRVTAWRLDRLRELWDEQDRGASPFAEPPEPGEPILPAIDPDIIGPEDLREPFTKPAATDPADAFDLWSERRDWVDTRLDQLAAMQPDLNAMMASLRPPAGTTADDPDYPWKGAPATSNFLALADPIGRGDDATAAAARETVRTKLWLPPDAFMRLVALIRRLAEAGPLTPAEWSEARSILVLALKRRRYELWRQEESAAGISVGPAAFWRALRQPLEGEWPPTPTPNQPLVDPETMAPSDAPLGHAGTVARGLWRARRRQLDQANAQIRAQRGSGLESMVKTAVGNPPSGTTWRARIAALAQDLESSDQTVVAVAETAIATELGLEPGPFRRLAAVEAKLTASQQPTEAEWLDVEAVLTSAHRRKTLYSTWLAEEQALGGLLPYWRARRAQLPRWRATPETRMAWELELRERSRPPAVDPDRFPATQLRSRAFNEPATTLYSARRSWLASRRQALAGLRPANATPLTQLDAVLRGGLLSTGERTRLVADIRTRRLARGVGPLLEEVFGSAAAEIAAIATALASSNSAMAARARARAANEFWLDAPAFQQLAAIVAKAPGSVTAAEWTTLEGTLADAALIGRIAGAQADAARAGVRVRTILEQLGLRAAAHAQLLRTREVAVAGGPILDDEWETVFSIVLRAEKQRRFGIWSTEELGATPDSRIRVGPDHFVLPDRGEEPFVPDHWLVTREETRDWANTLRSRTEQDSDVALGMRDAVSRVEETALPILRDALLRAIAPPAGDPAAWVSDHFLVDARAGGCRLTTRAAYAIDTILALLWSLRTGQLRDTYSQLSLYAPTFDGDWRWIGSYSTWRSAVLVRLYPENLLRPNLRRRKTPVFAEILRELRSGRDLTPTRARQLARRYAAHLRDVTTLDLGSVACATASWAREEGALQRLHDFVFAISEASAKVYWTTVDRNALPAEADYAQAFWQEVPGLGGGDVVALAGAAAYQPHSPTQAPVPSWVYVFAVTQDLEGLKLVFVRFNLVTRQWEDRTDLEAPKDEFTARVLAGSALDSPSLAFEVATRDELGRPGRDFYVATMNRKGLGWDREGLRKLPRWQWSSRSGQLVRTPRELLAVDPYGPSGNGVVELAAVPAGAGPIEFHAFTQAGMTGRGMTARSVDAGSLVCVGDLDADRRMEIAWTLEPRLNPPDLYRTTAVLIEKRNLSNGQWQPHSPAPGRADGASAAALNPGDPTALTKFIACGDVDGVNGEEILLGIQESEARVQRPGSTLMTITGTWNAFWAIWRFGNRYQKAPFGTYAPDPDLRTIFEALPAANGGIGAVFNAGGGEAAASFAVVGDYDGDGLDELVVFVGPTPGDSSRGNDFWALDRRSDRRLRRLGGIEHATLRTQWDLSTEAVSVAAAIAADVDGDGRDELIAIPWINRSQGSRVWIADFRPGGAPNPADGGFWTMLPDLVFATETTPVASLVAADLDGDGADELLLFGSGRSWARKYDAARGSWEELPPPPLPDQSTVAAAVGGRFLPGYVDQVVVSLGTATAVETVMPSSYNRNGDVDVRRRYQRTPSGTEVRLLELSSPTPGAARPPCAHSANKPILAGVQTQWPLDDTASIAQRRVLTKKAWDDNATMPASVTTYLWEAFYGLPVAIALQLQRARQFTNALDWLRLAYDYTAPLDERKTYYGLVAEESLADTGFEQSLLEWLKDPLDVFGIAGTRPHTATRATLLLIIRCLLDAADADFTVDTSESIERARLLYETALDLLELPLLNQSYAGCSDVIGRVLGRLEPEAQKPLIALANTIAPKLPLSTLEVLLGNFVGVVAEAKTLEHGLERARNETARTLAQAPIRATISEALAATADRGHAELLREPEVAAATLRVGEAVPEALAATAVTNGQPTASASYAATGAITDGMPLWGFATSTGVWFCVSPNPLLEALRLHAELNLHKIRTCRNIAGMRRALEYYSGATDQTTGLPMIGANGELVLPGGRTAPPTPYRYAALVQRARELTQTAQQLESLLLSALERRDTEAYTLLQARQNAQVARETVRLNELQVRQAELRVVRAQLQQERAQIEQDYFLDLLEAGPLEHELEALALLQDVITHQRNAAILQVVSAAASAAAGVAYGVAAYTAEPGEKAAMVGSAFGAAASAASSLSGFEQTNAAISSTQSQISSMRASLERMRQDWQFRQLLATQDIAIAAQETRVEEESVRIAEQQRTIAELDADHAEQLIDFLHNKFTSVELYEWMIPILERAYATVLQHGAAMGRLARAQLAFERQGEEPPAFSADYWQPPAENGGDEGAVTDRRGLLGAERLLADLVELDQFAFETNRRKLQLTRNLSLAQLAPLELERLRTTGVASFATPSELFDRDFPGHYLRLIKRVGVSLVALVPPTEGIRATLASSGISRVVVGPEVFQEIVVRREPQSIALTTAINGTGVFPFEPQPELANPFEFDGVSTNWELRLAQPSNPFDFRSIADVLITIDYTALESANYREHVVRQLGRDFFGDRAFSLRNDFPDAWWDLHNPDQSGTPLAVTFDTVDDDFPPMLDDVSLEHLAAVISSGRSTPRALTVRLRFAEERSDGGPAASTPWLVASPVEGVASTRRGNASAWFALLGKRPVGRWWLSLPNTEEVREWLEQEELLDLQLVLSFRGETPPWPA